MFRARRAAGAVGIKTVAVAAMVVAGVALTSCGSAHGTSSPPATTSGQPTTTSQPTPATTSSGFPPVSGSRVITLQSSESYSPRAPSAGGTDDYHCSVLDPHLTQDSYIVGTDFVPNSPEVHHAILFEVMPGDAQQALAEDAGGKGWSCFGDFGIGQWLAVWAPGHGLDLAPRGTGFYFPRGSMVIMQVHYNMLAGDKPTHVQLNLQTVPAAGAHLTPLQIDPVAVPPDVPCPAGVNGPLCSRAASLAELGRQFGPVQVAFVDELEQSCGRNPADPPSGDTTSCTKNADMTGTILLIQPHMHLLGVALKVTLDAGTAHARVLLDDTAYNFDYQRSFDMAPPVRVTTSDTITVQCTYNPRLAQQLPQLRQVPPHFVTWGDGSSDEMCLAIITYVN